MNIDPDRRALFLMVVELAIALCYLFLGTEHRTYLVIGFAHFVSSLLHRGERGL
jgi:hypothetical protein